MNAAVVVVIVVVVVVVVLALFKEDGFLWCPRSSSKVWCIDIYSITFSF